MPSTFRLGPARIYIADSFSDPVSDWTEIGITRGNTVVDLTHSDIALGRTDQAHRPLASDVYQTPASSSVRFLMSDRDVQKLVQLYPSAVILSDGAKKALTVSRLVPLTPKAFALAPIDELLSGESFVLSDSAVYYQKAVINVGDSINVANAIEDTDDALSGTAFEVTVTRYLSGASGIGNPLLTGLGWQGALFAYQPSLDGITPLVGEGAGTFTRATTATYVDDDGVIQTATSGTPRYQDGGILLEPQRTNKYLWSQVISTGVNVGDVTFIDNDALAPDGTTTASRMTDSAVNGNHRFWKTIGSYAGTETITQSAFVKLGTNTGRVWLGTQSDRSAVFNLQTVSYSDLGANTLYASIRAFADGWYRISVTYTAYAGTNYVELRMGGGGGYAGTSQYIWVWGVQHEDGSYPTSYIPTTGSTVTRNSDTISHLRPSGLSVQSDFTAILNLVPQFGDGQATPGAQHIRIFGDVGALMRYYVSSSPLGHAYEIAGFTVDASEAGYAGTVTKDEDTEVVYTSDADGSFTIEIFEEGVSTGSSTETWSAIKNGTDEWGGTNIIKVLGVESYVIKSFIVVKGLLTPSQIRKYLR